MTLPKETNEKIKTHEDVKMIYVLDTFAADNATGVEGLRSLARAPSPDALSNLQRILSHVMMVAVHDPIELPMASHSTTLQDIMLQNPLAITKVGFRKISTGIIFSGAKICKAIVEDRDPLFLPPLEDLSHVPSMMFNGKTFLNEDTLLEEIKKTISTLSFEGTCNLCFEDKVFEKLRPACGNCSNCCCQGCLTHWYQQNKPGQLFIPSYDACPFCRQRPRYQVLSLYNSDLCGIAGHSRRKGKELRLRADWYYGWCKQCWKVDYALDKHCTDGNVPVVQDFTCEECQEKNQLRSLAAESEDASVQICCSMPSNVLTVV